MAGVTIKLNPGFKTLIRKRLNSMTASTARGLRDEMRNAISVPFPPSSYPGNPPHKRSGATYRSIKVKKIEWANWAVYAQKQEKGKENLAIWLELGTGAFRQPYPAGHKGQITGEYAQPGEGKSSMEARPFMLSTVVKHGKELVRKSVLARK
jgi:hypothetical protein